MLSNQFSIVKGGTINRIIEDNSVELFHIIKKTYHAHFQNKVSNPNSCFLRFLDRPTSRIIALPAAITDENPIAGMKWIASNPENVKKGLERASAVILLNDYETGIPYACLEGATISATRTVYSAILAAELLKNNKIINNLGIIGSGYIAGNLLRWLQQFGWKINDLHLHDISLTNAQNFSEKYAKNFNPHIYDNFQDVILKSDLIVFTTTSLQPYVNKLDLFAHSPLVLHLSLRDLSPEVIVGAANFVDDIDHVLDANTSVHLAYKKTQTKDFIKGTIGQLLNTQNHPIERSKPIIFSPMGMGMLDVALAHFVFQKAVALKQNIVIDNFLN